jgi:hypothetical protein
VVSERQKLGLSAGFSLAGHALAAGLLLMAPTRAEIAIREADEIAIEIEDTPPPPPPALVVTPPDTPPVAASIRPRHVDSATQLDPISDTAPQLDPTTPLVAIPLEPSHEPSHDSVVVPREQLHDMLDPTRVAAADALHDDHGPSQPGPPATLHPEGPDDHGPTAEEAVAQTEAYLGAAAAAKTYITQRTFHLTPHTDGTLHWQGTGFEAVIHPDGSVSFSDHPDVTMDWAHGSGGFDITDMIMHGAGQDPYAAEREWFMEHAESTINRLETQARASQQAHSLTGVRSQVRTIWGDTARSAADRRRAIFEVWDECADGEEGADAREAIVAFIRREIPAASADSYTMIELARMNAHRQSAERFDPYP